MKMFGAFLSQKLLIERTYFRFPLLIVGELSWFNRWSRFIVLRLFDAKAEQDKNCRCRKDTRIFSKRTIYISICHLNHAIFVSICGDAEPPNHTHTARRPLCRGTCDMCHQHLLLLCAEAAEGSSARHDWNPMFTSNSEWQIMAQDVRGQSQVRSVA